MRVVCVLDGKTAVRLLDCRSVCSYLVQLSWRAHAKRSGTRLRCNMVMLKSGAPVGNGGPRGAAKVSAAKPPRARNAQSSEQQRCRPPRSSNRENKDPKAFESMDAAREYLMSQRSGPSLQTALNWWSESAPALAVQFS